MGVKEGWRRRGEKTEDGGIKEEKGRDEAQRSEIEEVALIARRNSHPIAPELSHKCKCIPWQPRNKQAATSLGL